MINFNEQLSQQGAQYIIEEVLSKRGWRIDRTTLGYFERGHNIAFKEQVSQPGCSCEMVATYNVWNSRLSQYEQQIRDIAYPPTKTETGETGNIVTPSKPTGKSSRKPKAQSGLTD